MKTNHCSAWRYLLLLVALIIPLLGVNGIESANAQVTRTDRSKQQGFTQRLSDTTPPRISETAPVLEAANPQADLAAAQTELPVPAPPEISTGKFRYFTETAHFLRGTFLSYWESHGATAILGLPLTEPFMEGGLAVQYLERARLEWHPEIEASNPAGRVLLARLGAITTNVRGLQFVPQPTGSNTDSSHFFTETGHNLGNAFLSFWLRNGGLAVFGYPLSEEMVETNEADGQQYTVQYFERNRFEWHPERDFANNVQLGLLGTEYARIEGLNPMARVMLPASFAGSDVDQSDSTQLSDLVDADILPAVQALGRTVQFKWVPALIVKHNIVVRFEAVDDEDVAGAFVVTRSRTRPYLIIIPETERGAPVETMATVIAHEATHGFDVVTGALSPQSDCSIEAELRAFMNGLSAWVLLQGEDALSQIYEAGSLTAAINGSLRRFNGNSTTLQFGFDPQAGRDFLRTLYGASCGR